MEIKQIKELMAVMQRTGTKRCVIKREGVELELEREEGRSSHFSEPPVQLIEENPLRHEMAMHRANMLLARSSEAPPSLNSMEVTPKAGDTAAIPGTYVTSPMVGTFYSTSSPGEPPFVKIGERVEKDTVVCIIEAMKVMNEVKAGVAGTVSDVLVENGHPVEFGSKLFRIT